MKINEISYSKAINMYRDSSKVNGKKTVSQKTDSLEISELGKSLSSYSIEGKTSAVMKNSEHPFEISKGTYKSNSKLTAQKIIDIVKGERYKYGYKSEGHYY